MAKQILQKQRAQNHQNSFYEKESSIAGQLNIILEAAVTMKKSEWQRRIKDKVQKKIQERLEKEIENTLSAKNFKQKNFWTKKYLKILTSKIFCSLKISTSEIALNEKDCFFSFLITR